MDLYNQPNLIIDEELPQINCFNKSPNELSNDCRTYDANAFSMLGFNIRSMRKNFSTFTTFLSLLMTKFTIIVLYETWLANLIDHGFNLEGYNNINAYRNEFGGGLKVFYDDRYRIERLDHLSFVTNIFEILSFVLIGPMTRFVILSIYRPPSSDPNMFNESLVNDILNRLSQTDNIIIIGDLNLNLYNPLRLRFIDDFVNCLLSKSFFPVINLPTRINENNVLTKFSLIDQIWTNFKAGTDHVSGVVQTSITDHYPIYYMFKTNLRQNLKKVISFRVLNDNTILRFVENVKNFAFENIIVNNDINLDFKCFIDKLYNIYNHYVPIKSKVIGCSNVKLPWMKRDLKRCIQKKYSLYNLYKRGIIERTEFNKYKNRLSRVEKRVKKLHYIKLFNDSNDIKDTWSHINELLNRKRKDEKIKLRCDNLDVSDNQVPEIFNNFFTSIASRLTMNMSFNIDWNFFDFSIPSLPCSFYFVPTCPDEIIELCRTLKNKGNVMFDIKPNIMLLILDKIAPILSYFYNKCIDLGVYPDPLKIARVVPISKCGNSFDQNNYRPISNLSVINKIFELLTFNRIISYINSCNILSPNQFGFRKNLGTTTAVFTLVNDLLDTFRTKTFTVALFLDLN